MWNIKSKSKQ